MSDLVERLRREEQGWKDDPLGRYQSELFHCAANRIKELEQENTHLKRLIPGTPVSESEWTKMRKELERLREEIQHQKCGEK